MAKSDLKLVNAEAEKVKAKFREVFKRANRTDAKPADLAEMRKMLGEHDELELWRVQFSPMQAAEGYVLSNTPMPEATGQVWVERVAEVRKDLGYDDAPPLEKLLIQHVALCHLRLAVVEMQHQQYTKGSHTLTAGVYWDRRLSAAQRRFTRAAVQLARVRKLSAEAERAKSAAASAGARRVQALLAG